MSKRYDVVLEVPSGAVAQPERGLTPQTFTRQRVLAAAGICAPILFALGFVMQGFLRTDLRLGYNPIAQEVSDLTAGPLGWVQQVNFLVFGLLVIAFGVGLYRGVRKASPWMVGPVLVVWNGIELIIAGLFPQERKRRRSHLRSARSPYDERHALLPEHWDRARHTVTAAGA